MARYSLKFFKRTDGLNAKPKSEVVQQLIDRSAPSSPQCGTETTYSISAVSPTGITQAEYIFDAVMENRSEPASSTDEVLSQYSEEHMSGGYITPIPRRLSKFAPPKSMFDGVPKQAMHGNRRSKSIKKLLPWKRVSSSRSVTTTPQSSNQVRSPYLSKKAQSKLSPALKNFYGVAKESPWHRPAPFKISPMQYDFGSHASKPPSVIDMKIIPSSSSDSCMLPPVISPAYKFVPIGCESDDDSSFSSADYEICAAPCSDVESNDRYASERDALLESKSFAAQGHSATVTYGMRQIRSEPMSTVKLVGASSNSTNEEEDLTPFEMDLRAVSKESTGAESCTPHKVDQTLSTEESASTFDASDEFSLVTSHVIKSPHSIENITAVKEDEKRRHDGNWWFVWDQLSSVMSCSA